MVVNEIHGNVLMRMLSVTYNTHTHTSRMMQQLLGQCVQQTHEVVLILEINAEGHTVIRCASEGQGLGQNSNLWHFIQMYACCVSYYRTAVWKWYGHTA